MDFYRLFGGRLKAAGFVPERWPKSRRASRCVTNSVCAGPSLRRPPAVHRVMARYNAKFHAIRSSVMSYPAIRMRRMRRDAFSRALRSEEHTSELQSHVNLVCRLLLEKKKKNKV